MSQGDGESRNVLSVVRALLDPQLVDSAGGRGGRADDLLVDEARGELAGSVTGPGAFRARSALLGAAVERLGFRGCTALDWEEVDDYTGTTIKLRRTASELGLAQAEEKARRIVQRVPFA